MENNKFRILLDPAGGLYRNEHVDQWIFQKKRTSGVQPDLVTSEIAAVAFDLLRTVGADVFSTRCMRYSKAEIGASEDLLFHEGAGQYLQHCRLRPDLRERPDLQQPPPHVWNDGADNLEKDARARINFCDHIKPDLMVTIDITRHEEDPGLEIVHNSAGGADALAENILREVAKRTHRKILGARAMREEDLPAVGCDTPVLILNCGSTHDLRTAQRLTQPWYRTSVALGLFAALWKHAAVARREEAVLR